MRRRAGVRLPARSRRVHFCAIGPCNADTPALIAASWAHDPDRFDRRVHPREERLLGTGRQAAPAGGDGGERTGSAVELRLLAWRRRTRSEEHTSELQSLAYLVCRLLLEKKKTLVTTVDIAIL